MIRKYKEVDAAIHLIHLGELVQDGWRDLAKKHGLDIHVSGIKPMSHFSFLEKKAQSLKAYFIQLMLDQGFLASNLFYVSYAHTDDHVKAYLGATDRAFAEIAMVVDHENISKNLRGKPSRANFGRLT